ncbi:hypothetical protein [Novosphingobium naphthalenivorans]|uniref:hypothetical protein n=1 Tax=Novosphingobium naphthalenivorans TaxID=273168 RepID=UPI0012EED2C0|nr:hypothetical protein [Novosphingobium naphthalenivorans]
MGALLALVVPMQAQAKGEPSTDLVEGFQGALVGCQEWVLNPASWSSGPGPFMEKVGLGDKMGQVGQTDPVTLPPEPWRKGNHYWRINSLPSAGYVLVVSDRLPICHITGGGSLDLQPVVERVLVSEKFKRDWKEGDTYHREDMVSTTYTSAEEPRFSMVVSRADKAGARLDRVQVVVSASMTMNN